MVCSTGTPIQELNEKLNNNIFYIKREDLFPFSFGGNKVRKAILFFEDIVANKCDCIVTYGSSSSNHCRVIANMAIAHNIQCYIVTPIENSLPTANSKMMDLFGAIIVPSPLCSVAETISNTMSKLKSEGKTPYLIEGGGHGNIGTQAYVNVYEEIIEYEKEMGFHFDYIFHTSGTGTTQAGLVCGKILHGDARQIVGISNARKNPSGSQVVLDSANNYLSSIGMKCVTASEVTFVDNYTFGGYGKYNDEILQTILSVLKTEGIALDPIYTGKGFYGMKAFIKENGIAAKNILYIHTGSTPLFFDFLRNLN